MRLRAALVFSVSLVSATVGMGHQERIFPSLRTRSLRLRQPTAYREHLKARKKRMDPAPLLRNLVLRKGGPVLQVPKAAAIPLMSFEDAAKPLTSAQLLKASSLPPALASYRDYIENMVGGTPEIIDHRDRQSPVRTQGERNTCVAHALIAALEASPDVPDNLSEEEAYHRFQASMRLTCTDNRGFSAARGAEILSQVGACEEQDWPYNQQTPADCPQNHQPSVDALQHRFYGIAEYRAIKDFGEDIADVWTLRAWNGKFVAPDPQAPQDLRASQHQAGEPEEFELFHLTGSRFALKSENEKYVAIDRSRESVLAASAAVNEPWEAFELVSLGGSKWALKASNGRFVSADGGKGGTLYADREKVGEWETFILKKAARNKFAIRSSQGKYVCAENDSLVNDRDDFGLWELFEVTDLGNGRIALRSYRNKKFVSADRDVGFLLVANRPRLGEWETFERVPRQGGRWALKAWNGKFVGAGVADPRPLSADRASAAAGEAFEFLDVTNLTWLNVANVRLLESILASGYDIVWEATVAPEVNPGQNTLDVFLDPEGNPLLDNQDFGLHAMLIVGYERPRQRFIVKNSWGQGLGDNGYFYFSYDYVKTYSHGAVYILRTSGP